MRFRHSLAAAGLALSLSTALPAAAKNYAVGPDYDTTHVYIEAGEVDVFVKSFLATFGGHSTPQAIATVTPTPSSTSTQLLFTPVGLLSVFGFRTPVPYPFGAERTGYLVSNVDQAVHAAQADGAAVLVAPFDDPIGRDAVIQWPGGINMQLYWHTKAPHYDALTTVPENRIYLPAQRVDGFVRGFMHFAHARKTADVADAPGIEIGKPGTHYRRIELDSGFGKLRLLVTDGQLPYPYGREMTGYQVTSVDETLSKATAAGATVLVQPYSASGRVSAMLEFPGGYIAEVHAPAPAPAPAKP